MWDFCTTKRSLASNHTRPAFHKEDIDPISIYVLQKIERGLKDAEEGAFVHRKKSSRR
jgi:hypothetical protein